MDCDRTPRNSIKLQLPHDPMSLRVIYHQMTNLEERIAISETIRTNLIHRVQKLSPGQQVSHANPGDFSPVEMLEHMALVEGLNASFIESSIMNGAVKKKAQPNIIYRFVMKRIKGRKRVPTTPQFIPKRNVSFESATENWNSARNRIIDHVRKNSEQPTAIKHKFFGRLSAFQLLDLLDAHCEYHDHFFPTE
jgi:hypothetical protein